MGVFISKSEKGFSPVEAVIILVVVALIAGAGYLVYSRQNTDETKESATAQDVVEAPEINETKDLDAAEAALDANDPETSNSDAAKVDAELDEVY